MHFEAFSSSVDLFNLSSNEAHAQILTDDQRKKTSKIDARALQFHTYQEPMSRNLPLSYTSL